MALLCGLLMAAGLAMAQKSAPQKPPASAPPAAEKPAGKAPAVDAQTEIARLDRIVFWLGLVCAIALMLPLPMCIYHLRRVAGLLTELDEIKRKLHDEELRAACLEAVQARNEKMETEIKQLQERFRVAMRTAQDKHQDTVERLKGELQALELENKRISGLLMLKEQVVKKQ